MSPTKKTTTLPTKAAVGNIDLRQYSLAERQLLGESNVEVAIYISNIITTTIPRDLFLAVSNKAKQLLEDKNTVKFGKNVDVRGMLVLAKYLRSLTVSSTKNLRLHPVSMSTYDMLAVTVASEALGTKLYTDHVYRACEAHLRSDLPSSEDLDCLTYFRKEHGRLFNIVSNDLAKRMRDDTIPDPEDFSTYLSYNHFLQAKIDASIEKHDAAVRRQEASLEAQARREAVAQKQEARKKIMQQKANAAAKDDSAFWKTKAEKEREMEKVCL